MTLFCHYFLEGLSLKKPPPPESKRGGEGIKTLARAERSVVGVKTQTERRRVVVETQREVVWEEDRKKKTERRGVGGSDFWFVSWDGLYKLLPCYSNMAETGWKSRPLHIYMYMYDTLPVHMSGKSYFLNILSLLVKSFIF